MRLNFVTVSRVIPFPTWGPDAINGMLSADIQLALGDNDFPGVTQVDAILIRAYSCTSRFIHISQVHISLESMCFHSHHALVPEER